MTTHPDTIEAIRARHESDRDVEPEAWTSFSRVIHADRAALLSEIDRLRASLEDAVDTLEAMDLHIDNPLYERLRACLES